MQLHTLQHLVYIIRRARVIETDDYPERDEIPGERIHEAAPETIFRNGPPECVHDRVQRLERLPHFLHAEREDLRVVGRNLLPLQIRLRQRPSRSLGQYCDLGGDVRRRRVPIAWFASSRETRRCGSNSRHPLAFSEQRRRRKPSEDVDAERFGFFAEPTDDLADRRDVVTVILHCRRRRDSQGATFREKVDAFAVDRCAKWEVLVFELREERADGDWIDDGSRQTVLTKRASFLENADLNVTQTATCLVIRPDESGERDRSSESSRPSTDEENIHRHRFSIGRLRKDQPLQRKRSLVQTG